MNKSKKEVDITATFFGGFIWWAMLGFLFVNALLFAADKMGPANTIREVAFYGILMLIILRELLQLMIEMPFMFYKTKRTQSKSNTHSRGKK